MSLNRFLNISISERNDIVGNKDTKRDRTQMIKHTLEDISYPASL